MHKQAHLAKHLIVSLLSQSKRCGRCVLLPPVQRAVSPLTYTCPPLPHLPLPYSAASGKIVVSAK